MKHVVNEQPSAEVLRNASFASLEGSAITPAAKKLVGALNERVVARIASYEAEPNAKKTNRTKLKKAVEAFLADLLMAQIGKEPKCWVYRAEAEWVHRRTCGYDVSMLEARERQPKMISSMPQHDTCDRYTECTRVGEV